MKQSPQRNCHHGHKQLHGRRGSKVECWSGVGASNSGRLSAWNLKITFPHSHRSVQGVGGWGGGACVYSSVSLLSIFAVAIWTNLKTQMMCPMGGCLRYFSDWKIRFLKWLIFFKFDTFVHFTIIWQRMEVNGQILFNVDTIRCSGLKGLKVRSDQSATN